MTCNSRSRKRSPRSADNNGIKVDVTKNNAREMTGHIYDRLKKFRERMSESKETANLKHLRQDIEGLKKASETEHGKERDAYVIFVTKHMEILRSEYDRLCEQVKDFMMILKSNKDMVTDILKFWRFNTPMEVEITEEPSLKTRKLEVLAYDLAENKENVAEEILNYVAFIRQTFKEIHEESQKKWKELIDCQELYVLIRQKFIQVTAQNLKEDMMTAEEWDTVLSEAAVESKLVQKKARAVRRF